MDEFSKVPMRYDITRDCFIPVTQEWVHMVQRQLSAFGQLREVTKRNVVRAQDFLDAWKPEFEQKK